MTVFPNAKINIGLHVIKKRADGFHDIETVFYPVGLSDILEVNPSSLNISTFTNTGIILPCQMEDNLCMRAYRIFEKEFDLPPVNIRLHKVIPAGSGLGGGSSDAVFMLKLLNEMFDLSLDDQLLNNYARRLGSDCPFFLVNKPCIATGRGDILKRIFLDLSEYYITIIHPGKPVITAEAYASITQFSPCLPLDKTISAPIEQWQKNISNDFEKYVLNKYPELSDIRDTINRHGALYCSLTGSGSAIYGIFTEPVHLKNNFPGMFSWTGKMK